MTYADVISFQILKLCDERKITVNKLATLSGLKQSTLDNIVKGNTKSPGSRTLHRIATGLELTVSQFLDIPELNDKQIDDE